MTDSVDNEGPTPERTEGSDAGRVYPEDPSPNTASANESRYVQMESSTDSAEKPKGPPAPELDAVSRETGTVPADRPADSAYASSNDDKIAVEADPAPAAVATAERKQSALRRPSETRIMTVSNQKGGVGKTTTTVNLAVALAMGGLKVLVIDLDPQGNASTGLGIPHAPGTPSTYNVVVDKTPLVEVAQSVEAPGVPENRLYCVPATSDLAGAEVELAGVMVGREFRLRQAITEFLDQHQDEERFDYIFVDCPPSLGLLTVNALASAGEVMIPVQCEYYALEGLGQLLETVELIRGYLNPSLEVSTMLLTMFDARTKLAGQVVDDVREHFGDVVMRTIIPRSVKVSEAPSYGLSVMSYDPGSRGAVAYESAARELVERK